MSEQQHESASEFAARTLVGFKKKADHNKNEALACFIGVIGSSLAAPLFVTLGEGLLLGKVVPSILSLCAAGLTAWLQLRKPQQLWTLYRTCQRWIEDSQTAYLYKLREFKDTEDRESLLASQVAKVAMYAHNEWVPLIPSPERIGQLVKNAPVEHKALENEIAGSQPNKDSIGVR
jgi:hypothetical protein